MVCQLYIFYITLLKIFVHVFLHLHEYLLRDLTSFMIKIALMLLLFIVKYITMQI